MTSVIKAPYSRMYMTLWDTVEQLDTTKKYVLSQSALRFSALIITLSKTNPVTSSSRIILYIPTNFNGEWMCAALPGGDITSFRVEVDAYTGTLWIISTTYQGDLFISRVVGVL